MTPLLETTLRGDMELTKKRREEERLKAAHAQQEAANRRLRAENERARTDLAAAARTYEVQLEQFRRQMSKEHEARMDALQAQIQNERREVRYAHQSQDRGQFNSFLKARAKTTRAKKSIELTPRVVIQ